MTDIIVSFDTEDFTSQLSADQIIKAAEMLEEEGIVGCFCMVGMLAKQLAAWGRRDVLEALKRHEIGFHSYAHSVHPTINEYTNTEEFNTAYAEFIKQEATGLDAVRSLTGVHQINTAVPPGNCESYVAWYGYHDLGLPCYAGEAFLDSPKGKPVFYCNNLYLKYYTCYETIVAKNLASDKAFFDDLASRETLVLYNHPNRMAYKDFWDAYNYYHENNCKFGEWKEAVVMSEEEQEHFRKEVQKLLRNLKADGRFRFTTYSEMVKRHCGKVRILSAEDMPGLRERLLDRFYPQDAPVSLCIADIFGAAVSFLRGDKLFAAKRVFGFLDTPVGISEPVTVTAEEVRAAALEVDLETFLPPCFMVGDKKIGPADFLFAMLDVLAGQKETTLVPRPQNIDLSEFGNLAAPDLDGWINPPSFKAEILEKRAPLQAWTIRF